MMKKSNENFMILNAIYIEEKTRNAWTITVYCKEMNLLFQKLITIQGIFVYGTLLNKYKCYLPYI